MEKNRELLNAKMAAFELSNPPTGGADKKGRNDLLDSLRPVLRRAWYYIGTLVNNKVIDIIALDK